MEIVDTTCISAADWVIALTRGPGFAPFLRTYRVACFVLTRTAEEPRILEDLVKHATAIDSVTGKHIAFIVFQRQTTVYVRASASHEDWQKTRVKIDGLEVVPRVDDRYDEPLEVLLRFAPERFSRSTFASDMTRATNALLERYHLRESGIPSLLFVNAEAPEDHIALPLGEFGSFQDVYSYVLKPIAGFLRTYDRVRGESAMVRRLKGELNRLESHLEHCRRAEPTKKIQLDRITQRLADIRAATQCVFAEDVFQNLNESVLTSKQRRSLADARSRVSDPSRLLRSRIVDFIPELRLQRQQANKKRRAARQLAAELESQLQDIRARLSADSAFRIEHQQLAMNLALEEKRLADALKCWLQPVDSWIAGHAIEAAARADRAPFQFVKECVGILRGGNAQMLAVETARPGESCATRYDTFIAHNKQDKPAVRVLAAGLRARGLRPWLDEDEIPPGAWFQDHIQRAIAECRTALVILGPAGVGRWQALELRAFISRCVTSGVPVIPVLLPTVPDIPKDLLFLREANGVTMSALDDSGALDRLAWGIRQAKP